MSLPYRTRSTARVCFTLRLKADLHRKLSALSTIKGTSVSAFIEALIHDATHRSSNDPHLDDVIRNYRGEDA